MLEFDYAATLYLWHRHLLRFSVTTNSHLACTRAGLGSTFWTVTVDNLCHWPHFGTIFIPPHLHVYSQAVDYRLPFLFFRVNMRFCWTLNLTGYKKLGYFWRTSTHCLECWKILDSFLMEVCFGLDERNSIKTLLSALVSTPNVIPELQECILLRPKSTLAATVAPKGSKKPLSTDSTGALSP